MNILIIFAEVGLVILVFILLRWILGKLFKLFIRLSILKSDDIKIKILRRNMILDINPTPILAGAGIVGIAVGLGAQTFL